MTRSQWILAAAVVLVFHCKPARAQFCNTSGGLSATVPEFQSRGASRVEALLRLGERYHLCFGIEEVDKALLTEPADIQLGRVTVKRAIESIVGSEHAVRIEQHYGVIEILPAAPGNKTRNIFEFIVPRWEAKRGMVQLTSWLLHTQLITDLNPQTTGFAAHGRAGDTDDQVGPFKERNLALRYLLDKIVAQSKGGAWIAQISSERRGDFRFAETHRIWSIVEYAGPKAEYATLLNGIATDM
jgi:hypothetical protein